MNEEDSNISPNGWNNLSLDERNTWELQKRRTIVISEEFEDYMTREVITLLEKMDAESDTPIKIIINSVGGSTMDGYAIIGTIEQMRSHVVTEARGVAASMGLLLLLAGDERRAARHTRFLLHEVSMTDWNSRKVGEWNDEVEELRAYNSMIGEFIVEKTKLSRAKLKKLWTRTDYWFNAETALKLGFIDEIV